MPRKKTSKQDKKAQGENESPAPPQANQVGFPMVAPPSRNERNQAKKPPVLRVCGNTIPVRNGRAGEADPKKIRAKKREQLKKRGLKEDEERI